MDDGDFQIGRRRSETWDGTRIYRGRADVIPVDLPKGNGIFQDVAPIAQANPNLPIITPDAYMLVFDSR